MVSEDANFIDLACLLKITPDTLLERFGSAINSSFFDASNIAGTLKQKGLIDFSSNYPGPNGMMLTDAAKALIAEANAKGAEPFDTLDESILNQLSGGKRAPVELGATLNLRPKDLALRLYKLYKQNYLLYELKSGSVELMLTENGFLKASAATNANLLPGQQKQQQAIGAQGAVAKTAEQPAQAQMNDQDQQMINQIESQQKKRKAGRKAMIAILIVIVIVFAYLLYYRGYI